MRSSQQYGTAPRDRCGARARRAASLPAAHAIPAAHPPRRRLAGVSNDPSSPDARADAASSRNAPLGWIGSGRAAFLPSEASDLERLPPLESFIATLNLIDTGARTSEDIYTGQSQWMPHGRIFGGQVAAQSIIAATRTVSELRPIHSMRGYFLRPGDIRYPITFAVDRIHDGGSFSTRHVQAFQQGEPIWSMIASFQIEEEGLDHQIDMPADLPDPDTLESEAEHVERAGESLANYWVRRRPFAMRHVDGPIYLSPGPHTDPVDQVWIKATGPLPDDPLVHRAALAYVSDYLMLDPALRRHGLAWTDPRIRVASLDHGVWWHRFARADEWLLFELRSPSSHGGRALSQGYFYDRRGRLVASVSQEAMLRLKQAPAEG